MRGRTASKIYKQLVVMIGKPPVTYIPDFHGEFETHQWLNKIQYNELGNTQIKLSCIGYGGSSLGGYYGDVAENEAIETIQATIKSGINYLDTSPWYGASEDILGIALKSVPREAYHIGTKAGRRFTSTWEGRFGYDRQSILRSVEASLQRLGLQYVDIIQIHDVEFCLDQDIILTETIPALESVIRVGKAKFIGITGYDLDSLKSICEKSHVDTILTYCRYNFHDRALTDYIPFLNEKRIGIINAAPLSMGLLSTSGPPKWHPADSTIREAAFKASEHAKNQGTTLERAALSFCFKPDIPITTTLVSMPTKQILQKNLEIATEISPQDETIYSDFQEFFGNKNNNWVGLEVNQYKEFINKQNSQNV